MKKTVLFITKEIVPYYYGGIGTLFMSLSKLLKEFGHEVCFLTQELEPFNRDTFETHYGDVPVYFVNGRTDNNYVKYSPSGGVVSIFDLAYAYSVEETFNDIYEEIHPDIVFSADYGAEAFVIMLKKAMGLYAETGFMLHLSGAHHEILEVYQGGKEPTMASELDEPQNQLTCSMEDTCMLIADQVISPSLSAWEQVQRRMGLNDKRAKVIPNILAPNHQFITGPLTTHLHEERYVLFVGRLDRHKGADILLKLFLAYLDKYDSEAKLIMMGRDCFCKEYGQTFLREWEGKIPTVYRDNIKFTGQVSHNIVKEYFDKATVCVFPSRWEVFGIVCLEAMSYGVPTFVSKDTGLAEILGDDLKEFVFDFNLENDLFLKRLHTILSGPDNNKQLRLRMRDRALEVIEVGKSGYRNFINDYEHKVKDVSITPNVLERLIVALKSTSDIAGFLGNDFIKLKEYSGISDRKSKEIIQGEVDGPQSTLSKIKNIFISRLK